MANSTKFLALAAFVAMAFGAKAQTCTYLTPNSSWTASEYFQIINIDAERLTATATGLAAHTAVDGEGTSTAFTSGSFTTPIMTTEDGETYTPTAVNWPVNYYMASLAPNFFNSAYTKVVLNGKNPSGGVTDPCFFNNNSIIISPIWEKKGFIELSRQGADAVNAPEVSRHGYIVIENLPQVERVQWSFSSTGWKRGVKLDIKHGNGDWQPLRWEASDVANTITSMSEQGYAFEEMIGKQDDAESKISLRWRIWDGDSIHVNPTKTDGSVYGPINPLGQRQVARIHQIRIFSNVVPAEAPNSVSKTNANKLSYQRNGNTLSFDAETELEIISLEGKSVYRKVDTIFDLSALRKGNIHYKST
jgi:hypothetical protein